MEFETSIDSAAVASALQAKIEEDAAAHSKGSFEMQDGGEGVASVTVHRAMHPQRSLIADVAWETRDSGSHVKVTYRTPREEETEAVGFFAPLAAFATMLLVVGGLMWALGFGLLKLLLDAYSDYAGLLACIAPLVYAVIICVSSITARTRARRRFEKLLKDLFIS